jgi:hypothetical protein
MSSQPDGFLAGIDPVSAFGADVEAEVAVEFERQMLGDVSNWKPEGLTGGSFAVSGSLGIEWAADERFDEIFGPPVQFTVDRSRRARLLRWLFGWLT